MPKLNWFFSEKLGYYYLDMSNHPSRPIEAGRTRIIACAVIAEELRSRLPYGIDVEVLDFGLHRSPEILRAKLQETIDKSTGYDTVVLGYGLCGMAAIGLQSSSTTIVLPKVDDCIAVFLGSRAAYLTRQKEFPGTLFLSKGWIEGRIDNADPNSEVFRQLLQKYGEERALRLFSVYQSRNPLRHYKRLAFITTSAEAELDKYKEIAQKRAQDLKLIYEEIAGSTIFMDRIAAGQYDDEFVVAPPGHRISLDDFWPGDKAT